MLLQFGNNIAKMNQQWQDDQNKVNTYITNNPIGQQTAQKLHRKFLKTTCQYFTPFDQYYHNYPVHYIIPPKPTFIQQESHQYKHKLSSSRQIQYLHGSISKQYIDEEYMESLLDEQMKNRGLVQNFGNRSLIIDGMFLFGVGDRVECVRIGEDNSNIGVSNTNTINTTKHNNYISDIKLVSRQFSQPIFQLAQYQGNIIIVRCRYWIYLFDISKDIILNQIRLKQEITSLSVILGCQMILICTYDQKNYRLFQWRLGNNQINCLRVCESFYPVNSMVNLNKRQFVVSQANQIFIEDLRCKERQTLKRISQIGNDRFCCIAQMYEPKNQIIVSRAKFLDVFDLRNSNPSLYSVRHFCEQSPPSCLLALKWVYPAVIAYSPHQNGSSLLFQIGDRQRNKNTNPIYQQQIDPPMLLFDSGKIYKGLYPKSITPIVDQNVLRLLHVDSSDGICLEVLKKQKQLLVNRMSFQNWVAYPQQPCKRWVLQKQIAPYLDGKNVSSSSESDSSSDQQEQQVEESQMFLKKNNYCSLDKFRNKICQLAKRQKQISCQKQVGLSDSIVSTFQGTLQDDKVHEILKNKFKKGPPQHKITQELLDFLIADWKI